MAGSFESDANDKNLAKHDSTANSDASSGERVPPYTVLGRVPVPTVSSCQSLLVMLEEYRGDIPFTTAIIKQATIDFTDNQSVLIQDVVEAAIIESETGIDRQFYVALTAFWESLVTRIQEEKEFFAAQKNRCTEIYEILRHSAFPYSDKQGDCLHRMLTAAYELTGHPNSPADKKFRDGLRNLVRLMQSDDHLTDPTPHRFIITHTINYYLNEMLTKTDVLAKQEAERVCPDFIHPHSEIDLASYLAVHLEVLVDKSEVLYAKDHFHFGMVEVYVRLVDIFKNSGLNFSERQVVVLQKVEREIRKLKRNPFMSNHHGITETFLEFMSELEENPPDREMRLDGDKFVVAEEGSNNKAIREISWDLVYLQQVASEHLYRFPTFGHGVMNISNVFMERFLKLYPFH